MPPIRINSFYLLIRGGYEGRKIKTGNIVQPQNFPTKYKMLSYVLNIFKTSYHHLLGSSLPRKFVKLNLELDI